MDQQSFELVSFIFVIILIIYVLTSHLIEVKKVPYLHESAIAIFMGMITSVIAKYIFTQILHYETIKFDNQLFFAILLPPVIFSAGYSLRKSLFFDNFAMTCFLGVIGTIIGFLLLTFFLILINKFIFQALTLTQVMMISSVLCATDTLAAMSLIKPEKYPVLNAVLFGQGIINDAVAIILFRTVTSIDLDSGSEQFEIKTILQMIFSFCYLLFASLALGVITGFGLSYVFKINDSFTKYSIKQASLILLNGYFTYLLGQIFGFSGIISLFTCAIIMGHYCFMNISEESQRGTGLAFQTVSYIAQAFVFAYLGASVFGIEGSWGAVAMGFMVLAALPFIRVIMVYFLPLIYCIFRKPFPITGKQLKVCWYQGLVRGVIAFALCLPIGPQHRGDYIMTVTLVIVMVTTVVGSTMLKTFMKFIGMQEDNQQQEGQLKYANMKEQNAFEQGLSSKFKNIGQNQNMQKQEGQKDPQQREQKKTTNLQWFQQQFIKPYFQKIRGKKTQTNEKQIEALTERKKPKQASPKKPVNSQREIQDL